MLQGRPRLKLSSTESENETKEREELDLGGGGLRTTASMCSNVELIALTIPFVLQI